MTTLEAAGCVVSYLAIGAFIAGLCGETEVGDVMLFIFLWPLFIVVCAADYLRVLGMKVRKKYSADDRVPKAKVRK